MEVKTAFVAMLSFIALVLAAPASAQQNCTQNTCSPPPFCGPQNQTQNGCTQIPNQAPGTCGPQDGCLRRPVRISLYPPRHGYLQAGRPLRRAPAYLKFDAASFEY